MTQSRTVPSTVRCMLWGRAAGRCQMCNVPVSWHGRTKADVNLAEAAHIVGFSEEGPRGESALSTALAADLSNLMLLCRPCHKLIDSDSHRYSVHVLRGMKREREEWVSRVTAIGQERGSQILLYGANVGEHRALVSYDSAAQALLAAQRYPVTRTPLNLGMVNSSFQDRSDDFWRIESQHLREMVCQRVYPRLKVGDVEHLSVFALAPQPLLILLGFLLCDINYETSVYQLHREPSGWVWQEDRDDIEFVVDEPEAAAGPPVLVLALSAHVSHDRIVRVLGERCPMWHVTITNPHNDFLRCSLHLRRFRQAMRPLLDRIKTRHGQDSVLHVFPAAPVSAAVELGRVLQPKADVCLRIYDQNKERDGFHYALDVNSS